MDSNYWNKEAKDFDCIYHEDGRVRGWLNQLLRRDMEGRFFFTLAGACLDSNPHILEIGCGTGVHAKGYLDGGAASVTGVDFSSEMLKIASDRLRSHGDKARLIEDDFMKADFAGRTFDVVTALGVFDYVADPGPLFAKAINLTKGRFIASFPRSGTLRSYTRAIRLSLKRCPVYFYSKEQLVSMAGECGARIEKHEIIGQLHCAIVTKDHQGA